MSTARRIGPSEDQLLILLARYVRATAAQLTRHSYSPNSLRHVRTYLNNLIAGDYVTAIAGFSQSGKPPRVYSLTMKGWRYVEEHHGMPVPTRWRPSEAQITDYRDYLHDLSITDMGIAIERFCRLTESRVTMVQFIHDRFLPQTKVPLPDNTAPSIRLDSFVELHIRRGESATPRQRCHLIEIDRGTHYEKAIRKKLLMQIHYVQDGHYQKDFLTESLTYLWVCPGAPERVRYLIRVVESVLNDHRIPEYAPLFRFTSEDPATVDPVDIFIKPCWFVPFSPSPVSLLAASDQSSVIRLDTTHFLGPEAYDRFLQATGEEMPRIASERDLA